MTTGTGFNVQQDPVRIRSARDIDLDKIEQIEQSCFEGDRLSRRSLRYLLQHGHCSFFVAETDHAVTGYAITLYRRGSRSARLYSIAVASAYRGQGIAGSLLDTAEFAAQSRGYSAMRLEVRRDNLQALGLYRGRGYRRLGIKQCYYEDGESAECLERSLGSP